MTTSLVSPSILPETHRPISRRKPFNAMTTCIDNSRAKTRINPSSYNSGRSQIDNSLCNYVEFSRPAFSDLVDVGHPCYIAPAGDSDEDVDEVWAKIREEALLDTEKEPILQKYYFDSILIHNSLEFALANQLGTKLCTPNLVTSKVLRELFSDVFTEDPLIGRSVRDDLRAAKERDAACSSMAHCLLYYKGFLAIQAHRVAHKLWTKGRTAIALYIQSRVSEVFAVDIHPGARIGSGILLDHATGVVIGETAVIGDNVSILHNVTLGGTGKASGDRHPKIGDGVLVGAGTQILGSVRVGEGAKIGAGSVVLKEVPPRTTAVGNPARLIGGKENPIKLDKMASLTMDHTSWSDYVI